MTRHTNSIREQAEQTASVSNGFPLTRSELHYLLSLNQTQAADISRRHLHLGDPPDTSSEAYSGAASSLTLRGLLAIEGESLRPVGAAQAITALLTTADKWVEFGLISEKAVVGALLVGAGPHCALLTVNPMDIVTAVAIDADGDLAGVAVDVVEDFLTRHVPATATLNVTDGYAGNDSRSLALRISEPDLWQVATTPLDDGGRLTVHDIDAGDLAPMVRELIAEDTQPETGL